jgi:predicted DNA-binding transcriptional regulator YafY
MTYADADGQVSQRRVRPLYLENRWGQLYLLAYCELRQDERRFRLDRIVRVEGDAGRT